MVAVSITSGCCVRSLVFLGFGGCGEGEVDDDGAVVGDFVEEGVVEVAEGFAEVWGEPIGGVFVAWVFEFAGADEDPVETVAA